MKTLNASLIFYENGSRLGAMLADALAVLGDRKAAVVREITKRFEECVTGSLSELAERYGAEKPKGEIVVIIGPPLESGTMTGCEPSPVRPEPVEGQLARRGASTSSARTAFEK